MGGDVSEGIADAFHMPFISPRGDRGRIAEAGLTGGVGLIEGVVLIKEAGWTVDARNLARQILK